MIGVRRDVILERGLGYGYHLAYVQVSENPDPKKKREEDALYISLAVSDVLERWPSSVPMNGKERFLHALKIVTRAVVGKDNPRDEAMEHEAGALYLRDTRYAALL